ncbi:MAG: CHASE domain-containing protein, partial [Planctomycetota bacterium]
MVEDLTASEATSSSFTLRRYAFVLLTICVGVGFSVGAFVLSRKWKLEALEASFQSGARECASAIQKETDQGLEMLCALAAFYAGSREVELSEFSEFVKVLRKRHPDIQALEWIPRVDDAERETCEKAARDAGFDSFEITERDAEGRLTRAAHRDEYFPVYLVEPYLGNEVAVGFDLASEPTRREALEKARDTGAMAATPAITLTQETAGKLGFLAFHPVYRKGTPTGTVEERRTNLEGFVLGVYRVPDLLDKALSVIRIEGIDLHLFETPAGEGARLLYHLAPSGECISGETEAELGVETLTQGVHHSTPILVADRRWLLISTP